MKRNPIPRNHILKYLPAHPKDIVTKTAQKLKISRQAVHRHLRLLIDQGIVIQVGTKKAVRYFVADERNLEFSVRLTPDLREADLWTNQLAEKLAGVVPAHLIRVVRYGFLGVMRNALMHSGASQAVVRLEFTGARLRLTVHDNGIGALKLISSKFGLTDPREAVLRLADGKLTTSPGACFGESLFFIARAFDSFALSSGGLTYQRLGEDDWTLQKSPVTRGTRVEVTIGMSSMMRLEGLFQKYGVGEPNAEPASSPPVHLLSQAPGTVLTSRKQGVQLAHELAQLPEVLLDFSNIEALGAAFVEGLFQTLRQSFPEVRVHCFHMNAEVEFILKRFKQTATEASLERTFEPDSRSLQ